MSGKQYDTKQCSQKVYKKYFQINILFAALDLQLREPCALKTLNLKIFKSFKTNNIILIYILTQYIRYIWYTGLLH